MRNAGLDNSILFCAFFEEGVVLRRLLSLRVFAVRFVERFLPLFFVVGDGLAIGMSVLENSEEGRALAREPSGRNFGNG